MRTNATRNAPRPKRAASRAAVTVQIACAVRGIPVAARFRAWARAAARAPATLTIRLVTSGEARALNAAYRGANYVPNVLSFSYARRRATESAPLLCGDIVLCPSVVAREARKQGKRLEAHFAHLTVHGVLHLLGYGHARTRAAARMERAEVRILRALGFADPYRAAPAGRMRPA
ncbi:MAG: rRNA maturation RNase YbeY [Betaproteobacteria bacterium]|nr:rRNA maturation RNase YbeY [Betaproteobacteria bacterium]